MSSFFVIANPPGCAVNLDLVARLLAALAWRGPDGQAQWIADHLAFGYAHLWVDDLTRNPPPLTFDEQCWLVADIRLDARDELCRALQSAAFDATPDMPDVKLLWQAYRAWGLDCLQRLYGDFAFVLWDAVRQRLFCARDRFAVKPLYYAYQNGVFVAASALDTVGAHPDVPTTIPTDLDDFAVADFLIHGMKMDEDGTFYRAIRRLPRASALCLENGRLRQWQYWTWPTDGCLRYPRPRDYIAHFQSVLEQAVADRLRAPQASVFLSGGLDSNVVVQAARRACPTTALRAFTNVFESLIPDDERHFAELAAQAHGIPITLIRQDDWHPYVPHPSVQQVPPEPVHEPFWNGIVESYRQAATHARILLTGQWGDEVLTQQTAPYLRQLLAQYRLLAFGKAVLDYVISDARNGFYAMRRRFGRKSTAMSPPGLPRWLATDFIRRLRQSGYVERSYNELPAVEPPQHPLRSLAVQALSRVQVANDHEYSDPAFTGSLIEMRYPLLDQRVVEFLLAIPPVPFCLDKWLFREILDGQLPRAVVRRDKTPLRQFPITGYIARHGVTWAQDFRADDARRALLYFVNEASLSQSLQWDARQEAQSFIDLSPLSLYKWMQYQHCSL